MRDKIIFPAIGVVAALLVIFGWNFYANMPETPAVGEGGKIIGNYSIAGIMKLGKPYVCIFEKTDGSSKINGTMRTDGKNIYGEFKIKTDLVKDEFSSFLLVKDGQAYSWTSLQPAGFISPPAKSASQNSSPNEQAQIVGRNDKLPFDCQLWDGSAGFSFEPPASIKFVELK